MTIGGSKIPKETLAMLTAAENEIDKKYLISLDWADRTFSREFESLFFKSTIRVKQK